MILSAEKITENIRDNTYINITVLESVDSTNKYLKEKTGYGAKEGEVVIADTQTGGRGRFTRKFYSPFGCGIYMSILLKPELPASDAVLITSAAAVAVAKAIESLCPKVAEIKWVNDVYINSKKVCGILTEGSVNPDGNFDWAVLGIGINAFEPDGGFDMEIKDIAGAVFDERQENLRNRLIAEVINNFFKYYKELGKKTFLNEYKERLFCLDKTVDVIRNSEKRKARALDIDDNCCLLVEYEDKTREYLSSGEISIRL